MTHVFFGSLECCKIYSIHVCLLVNVYIQYVSRGKMECKRVAIKWSSHNFRTSESLFISSVKKHQEQNLKVFINHHKAGSWRCAMQRASPMRSFRILCEFSMVKLEVMVTSLEQTPYSCTSARGSRVSFVVSCI